MKKGLVLLTLLHGLWLKVTTKLVLNRFVQLTAIWATVLCVNPIVFAQVTKDRMRTSSHYGDTTRAKLKRPGANDGQLKATSCSSTTTGTIPFMECDAIGTPAFNSTLLNEDFFGAFAAASSNAPSVYGSPNPTCWPGGVPAGEGTWNVLNLAAGVESISLKESALSIIDGAGSVIWMTFYQGTGCSNLTQIACETFLTFDGVNLTVNELYVDGLDDSQPLWIYTSSDGWFDLYDLQLTGFTEVSNTTCASAGSTNEGCNVGAPGDTGWLGPSAFGEMCFGTNCTYSVRLFDSFNDGWTGGGQLRIFLNGVLSHTFTIGAGQSGATFTFSPLPNQFIEVVFHTGTFNGDNAVILIDPLGFSSLLFGYNTYFGFPADLNYLEFQDFAFCSQAWYSNENTVYYSFTATEESGSISVENAICNDGTVGEMQIGVWRTCGSVGTYGTADFVGCAVGNGNLQLPDLEVGESYILVADGQAGDVCTWDFVTDGITLPVELILLEATARDSYNEVYWKTATERNSDYFVVERSFDGVSFTAIDTLKAAGHSTEKRMYVYNDYTRAFGHNYYRLKQVDFDGQFEYFGPRLVMVEAKEMMVVPNPVNEASSFTLVYAFEANTAYTIVVTDLFGREVLRRTHQAQQSTNQFQLSAEHLASGVYSISVSSGDKRESVRFVKE
jgi:hypothetical protein